MIVSLAKVLKNNNGELEFKKLVDKSNFFVLLINSQGKILYANKKAIEFSGYDEKEVIGKKINKFIYSEDIKESFSALVNTFEKEVKKRIFQTRFINKNKEISFLELESIKSQYLKEDVLVVIIKDITRQKKAENDLRQNEKKYRTITENAPVGIFYLDLKGNVIEINNKILEIFNIKSRSKIIKINIFDFSPLENTNILSNISKCFKYKQKISAEESISIKNEIFYLRYFLKPVYENNKINGLVGIVEDISELKKEKDALKQAMDIVENLQEGIYIYHLEDINDDTSLRLTYANPVAEKYTGIKNKEVLNKTIDENFPGLREMNIPQRYAEVVRTQKPIKLEDVHYNDERVMDGFFAVKAFPLPENNLAVSFENITKQKQSEQKIFELYKHLGIMNRRISIIFDLYKKNKDKNKSKYLDLITQYARTISSADICILYKKDKKKSVFRSLSVSGNFKNIFNYNILGYEDAPYIFNILHKNERVQGFCEEYHCTKSCPFKNKINSFLVVPVITNKNVNGIVFLGFKKRVELTTQELDFYELFASQISY
ncbi:MAG: PAS domain S-box protein [Minisyncoccales bacterium]